MISYPDIDPIAFQIGPLKVHWYGIMYLLAFLAAWWLGRWRCRQSWRGMRPVDMDDLLFFAALGVVVGGRLGYVLFYDFPRLLADPLFVFQVWKGGMSFHGGLIGVIVAMAWFARSRGLAFFAVADFVAPLVPPGLLAGRIGNFINGHLWGGPSNLPWAMVFPDPRAGGIPRHPSQLYEAALEGVVLFIILWLYSRAPRPLRAVSGLFLAAYGVFRFAIEFVRIPDVQLGYLAFGWFTMGQALSLPMIIAGVGLIVWAYARPVRAVPAPATPPEPAANQAMRSPAPDKPRRRRRKRK